MFVAVSVVEQELQGLCHDGFARGSKSTRRPAGNLRDGLEKKPGSGASCTCSKIAAERASFPRRGGARGNRGFTIS
ncbi:MAG: hypothetical protein M0015_09310 [Betaproteobacteria bacterium]|nr:hypothetical protein [Betaproteobacteria bacterium]